MLPPKSRLPEAERRLLALFKALSPDAQAQLTEFAEFLVERASGAERQASSTSPAVPAQPLAIPRPESESVIAAIRRLSATFPMLDREPLLHATATLMTAHVMQGRAAVEVIDELELVFRSHYERRVTGEQVE
jgi:hypothetical protein